MISITFKGNKDIATGEDLGTTLDIIGDNIDITQSRLALCKAASIVLKNALTLVGVTAPTHM